MWRFCVAGPTGSCSRLTTTVAAGDEAADGVRGDVAGDLRVLLQAAQRVRVPVPAERCVDAEPVPAAHELVAERGPDAEQHLELVVLAAQPPGGHEPLSLLEEPLVMRRDA